MFNWLASILSASQCSITRPESGLLVSSHNVYISTIDLRRISCIEKWFGEAPGNKSLQEVQASKENGFFISYAMNQD
jgi:hypothetical protein